MSDSVDEAAPQLAAGTLFAGKYRVQRILGEGGFGAVYLVLNELDWELALKVLHPNVSAAAGYRKRFLREMDLARDLLHENAVPVRDAGVADGQLYYTMDFVPGRTLTQVIKEEGRIDPVRVIAWADQTLSFLQFLHGRGYLHRDLKPDNLMLQAQSEPERVRVLDLGIAKSMATNQGTLLTQGHVIGTPHYMSPEQAAGDELDARSDIYALGVILFQCCSAVRPYTAPTVQRLFHLIHTETPPPLTEVVPGISPRLSSVIEQALAKERTDRHPDASSLRQALLAVRDELGDVSASTRVSPAEVEPAESDPDRTLAIDDLGPGGSTRPLTVDVEPAKARTSRRWVSVTLVVLVLIVSGVIAAAWPVVPSLEVLSPLPGEQVGERVSVSVSNSGTRPFQLQVGFEGHRENAFAGDPSRGTVSPETDATRVISVPAGIENPTIVVRAQGNGWFPSERVVHVEVVVDRTGPLVTSMEPAEGARIDATAMSGATLVPFALETDEALQSVTVAGRPVPIDATGRGARTQLPLEPGPHTIPVVLTDVHGNRTMDSRSFTLRPVKSVQPEKSVQPVEPEESTKSSTLR